MNDIAATHSQVVWKPGWEPATRRGFGALRLFKSELDGVLWDFEGPAMLTLADTEESNHVVSLYSMPLDQQIRVRKKSANASKDVSSTNPGRWMQRQDPMELLMALINENIRVLDGTPGGRTVHFDQPLVVLREYAHPDRGLLGARGVQSVHLWYVRGEIPFDGSLPGYSDHRLYLERASRELEQSILEKDAGKRYNLPW